MGLLLGGYYKAVLDVGYNKEVLLGGTPTGTTRGVLLGGSTRGYYYGYYGYYGYN